MKLDIYQVYHIMSGNFLTERIPVELFDTEGFDEIDDFIREHVTDVTERLDVGEIWELIEGASSIVWRMRGDL
jgi:hypothetical protein